MKLGDKMNIELILFINGILVLGVALWLLLGKEKGKMIFKESDGKIELFDDQNSKLGEITYKHECANVIACDHTFVDDKYRGKGYAQYLLNELAKFARENDLMIRPICPYVKRKFNEDAQYADVYYK